jgi:hypothetical protein
MVKKLPKHLSWRTLNAEITGMDEAELVRRIQFELETDRRITVVERLHQRYTALRASRERMELFAELTKGLEQ